MPVSPAGQSQSHSSASVDALARQPISSTATPSNWREDLLQAMQNSTEAVLSQLRPGDANSSATQELQEVMLPHAQRDLEARVDEMALRMAEVTNQSP